MAEFTKLKIGFALALLGTLFALHPLLDRTPDLGFTYLGFDLKVIHAYVLTSGLLGICVYLYAVTLLNDHPHSLCEASGGTRSTGWRSWSCRSMPACFSRQCSLSGSPCRTSPGPLRRSRWGWDRVGWHSRRSSPGGIRRRLGERDRASKMEQLAKQESVSLHQAKTLLEGEHFDLSVVESWRALEARLRRALLSRKVAVRADDHHHVVRPRREDRHAERARPSALVAGLERHWSIAVSTDPSPREAAVESLSAVRYILSTLPVQADRPAATKPMKAE